MHASRFLALLVAFLPLQLFAADPVKLPAKDKFHLFLLVGQSNMAGRGKVEEPDKTPHPRVLMLSKAGEWVPAVDPLHFDKSVAGVGLGKTFGTLVAEANPDITVGLIPCAVGGSPIDAWQPGEFYQPTNSHPWDDALKRAKLAQQAGTLKGILWHQGESDSNAKLAPGYEKKLHALIAAFRKELSPSEDASQSLPFLCGQMGKFEDVPWDAAKEQVHEAHANLPKHVARTAYISAEGFKHKGDKVHFDSESLREFGKRYAEAYLKLSQ